MKIWVCLGRGILYIIQISLPSSPSCLCYLSSELVGLSSRCLRRPGLICESACRLCPVLLGCLLRQGSKELCVYRAKLGGLGLASPEGFPAALRKARALRQEGVTAWERRQLWLLTLDHQPGTEVLIQPLFHHRLSGGGAAFRGRHYPSVSLSFPSRQTLILGLGHKAN